MSDLENFHLSKKSQVLIYSITGVAAFAALLLVFSPATIEQREAFTNFMIGISALEIGLMLYLFRRKFPAWEKFWDSMAILLLFMASVGLTFPLLVEYHVGVYYFLLIYLIGLNGWLFFAKHVIYGKNNWQDDPTKKRTLVPWYILIGLFFPMAIALVVFASEIPNWLSL